MKISRRGFDPAQGGHTTFIYQRKGVPLVCLVFCPDSLHGVKHARRMVWLALIPIGKKW